MNVTREEIVKLAMKAHINGQYYLADNLRDVAAVMDCDSVKGLRKDGVKFEHLDKLEKSLLLTFEEING